MAKIQGEDLQKLRDAIAPLDSTEIREAYRTGAFPRSELVKDLNVRYRWDLFWAVKGYQLFGHGHDYTSAHIDTALRGIVPAL